jgi:hypothetical protein
LSGPFDPSWILSHIPGAQADASRVKPIPSTLGGTIGAVPQGPANIPLPEGRPPETRESWIMGHLSDAAPIVGAMRGVQAAHETYQSGHPLLGTALAALSVLPDGAALAKGGSTAFREVAPEAFHSALKDFATARPSEAGFLTWRSPEQMRAEGMRTFLSHDAKTGYAVHPATGDIRNVFNHGQRGLGAHAVADALANNGGKVLDAFDTNLGQFYRDMGFHETDRFKWNDQYRPATWDESKYGRPDVIAMAHEQAGKRTPEQFIADYEEARAARKAGPQAVARPTPGLNTKDELAAMSKRADDIMAKLKAKTRTLPDSVAVRAAMTGTDDAARVLKQFQSTSGAQNLPRVTAVDRDKAAHMAKLYDALPKHDPAAASAYDALNREVEAQHQAILDAGHTIEYVDHDPYKNSKEMIADVRDNKRLKVFKTQGDQQHPYMTPEQNDRFRAVHDWLAHAGEGHSFGPIGEENAYRVHASTLSPEAQQALATETRGQNSWVNFGPHSHLPVTQRPYAEQKAALWPKEFLGDYGDMNTAPFYSRTERAIDSAPFAKGTAEQWAAHLAKNSAKGEREWTGVDPFLARSAGKVLTREQVKGAFTPIELGEKTLGDDPLADVTKGWRLQQNPDVPEGNVGSWEIVNPDGHVVHFAGTAATARRDMQTLAGDEAYAHVPATKFAQYTEPGGTNYREQLTTLKSGADDSFRDSFGHTVGTSFRSSHFDEPNILLHHRLKDRTLPNGEKVLHIEELQSDWHQKGRASGYQQAPPDGQLVGVQTGEHSYRVSHPQYGSIEVGKGVVDSPEEAKQYGLRMFMEKHRKARSIGVPDAPFKKTEDWQLLGIKRAIHDAVHGGYDRVAWTPGDLQAARYDLSKQVDRLDYHPSRGQLLAWKNGSVLHEGTYDPKALPDVVGKEAAERLLAAEPAPSGMQSLQGDDLKVGGAGMKAFYDRMLPSNLKDYFKKLGLPAPEIEHVPIEEKTYTSRFEPGRSKLWQKTLPSFKITPELRRLILAKGQPLWAVAPIAAGAGLLDQHGPEKP